MSDEIKRISIKEFRELGFLQEANRQFFHPLGLALEVVVDEETGDERLGGVWDYREDTEGMIFGPGVIDPLKVGHVSVERAKHFGHRINLFKSPNQTTVYGDVQPLDWTEEDDGT